MADRWVAANSSNTTASGLDPGTPVRLDRANSIAQPGDTINLYTGVYSVYNLTPTNTGTGEATRIVYRSAPDNLATIDNRSASLVGKTYITLYNLRFVSRSGACVHTGTVNNNTASHLIIDSCRFEDLGTYVEDVNGQGNYTFAQLNLRGRNFIVRNCVFNRWKGTDCVQLWGEGHLIEDNDFNLNDAGHGSLICYAGKTVVRRNYFRDKWSRGGEQVGMSETDALYYDAPDCLWEDNIFFDVGFAGIANGTDNEGYDAEGWAVENGQEIGDIQLQKLGGSGTIYRNNLWVGSNEAQTLLDDSTRNVIQIIAYDRSSNNNAKHVYMEHMRVYHNTLYDNKNNGVYFNPPPLSQGIPTEDVRAEDNRWLNNIIHNQDLHDWYFLNGTNGWLNTWHFHGNIFTGTVWDRNRSSTPYTSFINWLAAWNKPSQAINNRTADPTFFSPKYRPANSGENHLYPESNREEVYLDRANFRLADTSPVGVGQAEPLAQVVTGGTDVTTLTLSDVYPFYPDDNLAGVDGDEILINGQTTRVMTRNKTTQVVTVSPAITASAGQDVWLAKYGASPDVGIVLTEDEEPEPPPVTSLQAPVQMGSAATSTSVGNTLTSPTLSPESGDLVLICVSANNAVSGAIATPFSIADTFSPNLSWTKYERSGAGNSRAEAAIFVAKAGNAPGSGTATVTSTNNMSNRQLTAYRIPAGYETTAPVVQSKLNSHISTTVHSLTQDNTPAANSLVFTLLAARGATSAEIEASFTTLYNTLLNNTHLQHVAYDLDDAPTTIDWTGTFTGNGSVAIALEIAESTSSVSALAGAASGSAAAAASLDGTAQSAGNSAGSAVADGTLYGRGYASAASSGSAQNFSGLVAKIYLAVVATASSQTSGDIVGKSRASATLQASSTASASLSSSTDLQGQSMATASLAAALTASGWLVANSSASSTRQAALTGAGYIMVAVLGEAEAEGTMVGNAAGVVGRSHASSTADASMSGLLSMFGGTFGEAFGEGFLTAPVLISAHSAASSSSSGTLSVSLQSGASSAGTGEGSGSLLASGYLRGTINGISVAALAYEDGTVEIGESVPMLSAGIWKKDQPNTVLFVLIDETGEEVTGLGDTFTLQISKSGGAFAASGGTKSEVGLGWYKYVSTASESNTAGPVALVITAAGTVQQNLEYVVEDRVVTAVEFTYTVTRSTDSSPIAGADVSFSVNSNPANSVWTGVTDAFGVARDLHGNLPRLSPGSYYVFIYKPGFVFENPDTEVVS